MHTIMRTKLRITVLLLVVMTLLAAGFTRQRAMAALPATPCTGAGTVKTCDLWAKTGSVTLPGPLSVTIWGYADSAGGSANLPGPTLIVNVGDTVNVTLTNDLTEVTALLFQGQSMIPDLAGVSPGGSKLYTFTATKPGTFLYEAGLLPNAQHQIAMGLYGALVVRPATPGQAYASANTAFDEEALLVLSELDSVLNNSPSPGLFDMRNYKPKFFLINGEVYPNTDPIGAAPGNKVLFRYVNAGLQVHSMTTLGLNQTLVAMDGSPFAYPHTVTAESIAPGQTLDAIGSVPVLATIGSKFPMFDSSLPLHNNRVAGIGGMLTFLTVGTPPPPGGDTTGPATNGIALSPNPANGSVDVAVTASVSDLGLGDSNITAAEFYIDSTAGTGTAMSASDLAFDSQTEDVEGTISVATLAGLSSGNHTIYVRGQDSAGNWGGFNFAVLNLDKAGPATTSLSLTPNPSNGTVNVALGATGDDHNTGNSNIAAAEYFIDPVGTELPGTGTSMLVSVSTPVASLTATIQAATLGALSEGTHVVSVRSQDAQGNWGTLATINLNVDRTGPTTSGVSANPNPNNGTQGLNSSTPVVRVSASFSDEPSNISTAEGFIDSAGADGTGFPFIPTDGLFNSPTESGYADIPLTTINVLAEGLHTLFIHGMDAAGNWGAMNNSLTLVIDKSRPIVSNVSASPNPTNPASNSFTLTADASDSWTNITAAEWFEGTDPGYGLGTPMSATDGAFDSQIEALTATIDYVTLGWAPGDHTIFVRARDSVGYWSLTSNVVVTVVPPAHIFADSFESGDLSAWNGGATGTPNISVSTAARMTGIGTYGMQTVLSGSPARYVTDLTPSLETSYHARFYFNPNGVLPNGANNSGFVTIFSGLNATNSNVFQVQFRRLIAGGGTYQVRLGILRAGGTTFTVPFNITNAAHAIEIAWQSGTSVSASLYIDGALQQTLTGLNTSAFTLESVRLGPSAGLVAASTGTLYFDAFDSTRTTIIGP